MAEQYPDLHDILDTYIRIEVMNNFEETVICDLNWPDDAAKYFTLVF